jgi:trans-aconitate methyltransferase
MTIKTTLYDQFRLPHGPLGVLAGRIMAKRSSNQQRSAWTVALLDVQPDDRVLELGYGPGLGLEAVLPHLVTGRLVGLDHSATMRDMARHRLRSTTGGVQAELLIGDVEALPENIGTFDKIFSCNVWLFWKDPVAVFRSLRLHLAPGGTLAVTHLPRHAGASRDAALGAAATITEQMERAGYGPVRQETLDLEPAPAVCILAS